MSTKTFTGEQLWNIWSAAYNTLAGTQQYEFRELIPYAQSAWNSTAQALHSSSPPFIKQDADPLYKGRIGRFLVADEILHNATPDLQLFFGNFTILAAQKAFGTRHGLYSEYVAYSDLFEVQPRNSPPPLYDIKVTLLTSETGERSYTFSATRQPSQGV